MRKIILFISMSLDGYIADDAGGIDWLNINTYEDDTTYEEFYRGIDTVLLGYNTYQQITTQLAVGNYPYMDSKSFVFTHNNIASTNSHIEFINDSPITLLHELLKQPGKDIWIVGGASLVKQVMESNLIDTYYIAVMPKLLGKGIPLFQVENPTIDLTLVKQYTKNEIAYLVYDRMNSKQNT